MTAGEPRLALPLARTAPVAVGDAGSVAAPALMALAEGVARALPPRVVDAAETQAEVLIVCGDRLHFLAALLGVWMRGHRAALAPNDRRETVEALRRQRGVVAVVGDGQEGSDVDVRHVRQAPAPREELWLPERGSAASVYTSGSTGVPTAHVKTFAQVLGEAQMLAALFGFQRHRVLATVPAHHIYGLLVGVLAPFVGGGTFVRETPLHPGLIIDAAFKYQADTLVASPAHLQGLAGWHHAEGVEAARMPLRRAFSSGAPLAAEVAACLQARWRMRSIELFGSTETGGIAHRASPAEKAWTPLPGVEVGATAEDHPSLCGDGAQAESDVSTRLRVCSPYAGAGWLTTADAVELLADGRFLHHGRCDEVVKVGGRRVNLAALQSRLQQVPGVRDVALVAQPAAPPRQVEIGCVVVAPGVSVEELRHALLEAFDPVALPRRWRFVNQLPRQSGGKVPRARLLAAFDPASSDHGVQVACETRARTQVSEGHARYDIVVPANAWFFQGHFEGDPLVPAVVQINDVVLAHAERAFADMPPLRQASRLKFKHPIRPGDLMTLNLRWSRERLFLTFDLRVGPVECSSGTLEFGGPA